MASAGSGQSPSGGGTSNRTLWWYAVGLAIGGLRLLVAMLPAGNAVRTVGAIVLPVGILVLLILVGLAAKRARVRPSLHAALVAVCYAVPAGLVKVLFPPTPAQVAASLQRRVHLTSAQIQMAQQRAESAAAHWEGFIIVIVVYALLGLLLGWIGSLFRGGRDESSAV